METQAKELYQKLTTLDYKKEGLRQEDEMEDMSILYTSIMGWWKPIYLLDHRNQTAIQLMDFQENLLFVKDEDFEWNSLKGLPEDLMLSAKLRDAHYPFLISRFKNDRAEVEWQLNPDGMYFMDEDGFGMTDDKEVSLRGEINREGKIIRKFHVSYSTF